MCNISRVTLLSLLLVLCIVQQAHVRPALPDAESFLEFKIKSDRSNYRVGQPINIEATIQNKGRGMMMIYSPGYWGVSRIIVKNAEGLRMKPKGVEIEDKTPGKYLRIPDGDQVSYTFNNLTWRGCGTERSFKDEASLEPGVYKIAVSIVNPPICLEEKSAGIVLEGRLTSNTITVKVVGKRKVSERQALEIAKETCRSQGWEWKDPRILLREGEYCVVTNSSERGLSAMVFIDRLTGKVMRKFFNKR
jgi:hypothetical protein